MTKNRPSDLTKRLYKMDRYWKVDPSLLLCPQVPKPLHGVAPRVILGSTWWNRTRQEAYRSTLFHCKACGVSKHQAQYRKWLEAHEIYEIDYKAGRALYTGAVPLCHLCHAYIHVGRLNALLQRGLIPQGKYVRVIQHGNKVLREAGLERNPVYSGKIASWASWRLVLLGKEYPPLYKTEDEWHKAFAL